MTDMRELEKILEEIEEGTCTFELLGRGVDFVAIDWVRDIIRKHMNDGWIPVEESLTEGLQEVWISTRNGTERAMYTENLAGKEIKAFLKIGGVIIVDEVFAWQPYCVPEPYHTERREHDR